MTDITLSSVIHIRPFQILAIEDGFEEEVKFFMPPAQGLGSLHTLESILLIKLMRIVNASYIFEFGTYKGLTTRLLLENLPEKIISSERIFTLDLPNLEGVHFQGDDHKVASEALGFHRKYLTSAKKYLVNQILHDSMTFECHDYLGKFQMIFIDGNHDVSYVKRDTENAFKMMSDAPSCTAWHDYGNKQFPELTAYIDDLAITHKIYHVENTMIAFHLRGRDVPRRD